VKKRRTPCVQNKLHGDTACQYLVFGHEDYQIIVKSIPEDQWGECELIGIHEERNLKWDVSTLWERFLQMLNKIHKQNNAIQ
jgi:hypothetical protein